MNYMYEYPKIAALEKVHPFFEGYQGTVRIEEKIDGSNVGLFVLPGTEVDETQLVLQSRTRVIDQDRPEMFAPFVAWAQDMFVKGAFARLESTDLLYGEMVGNGKIRYQAPPFLLFDIRRDLSWRDKPLFTGADYIHTWVPMVPRVPLLYKGPYQGIEHVRSFLGPSKLTEGLMEGVVVKGTNVTSWYTRADGEEIHFIEPLLCGKVVREDYKEIRAPKKDKMETVPMDAIVEALVTEARIDKARVRAQEEGKDVSRPHVLIPYVIQDVFTENDAEVREYLYQAYRKELSSAIAKKVGTS